jgi:hypothetical protein
MSNYLCNDSSKIIPFFLSLFFFGYFCNRREENVRRIYQHTEVRKTGIYTESKGHIRRDNEG